jgi:hypothetical protein
MLTAVQGKVCPFCGLSTDVPHETQQGCIEALHAEITRMRGLLDTVRPMSGDDNHQGAPKPDAAKETDRKPS